MDIFEAIAVTQERLAKEGADLAELLGHLRDGISTALIGEREWERVLDCAGELPISMGAQPFGFELPLHDRLPRADFGVSLASGNRSGDFFEERAQGREGDETARAITRLFAQMEAGNAALREVVGRKLMLEYDIGSSPDGDGSMPGLFLRPNEQTLFGGAGLDGEVGAVVDALVSCVGWEPQADERRNVQRVYLAQPEDTRMDSFGVFPSRERAIRLAVMGFKTPGEIREFLARLHWPGDPAAVEAVLTRFNERAGIERTGLNLDVGAEGLGPTLGLTPIVKQRYADDPRSWIDGLTDWQPLLDALGREEWVVAEKIRALGNWTSKPTTLFARTGRFVMLSGIHHIKLVVSGDQLKQAKGYIYMVLSGALSP